MSFTNPPMAREIGESLTFNPNHPQTSSSPPTQAYLSTPTTAFKAYWYRIDRPQGLGGRAGITAVFAYSDSDNLDLVRQYINQGTVALFDEMGRTYTVRHTSIEAYSNFSNMPGFPKLPPGRGLAMIQLSCAASDFMAG
jgi:hypothetical protein